MWGSPRERPRSGRAARGWTTVRSLPPDAIITMEYLSGRLNFAVDKDTGTVLRCWPG